MQVPTHTTLAGVLQHQPLRAVRRTLGAVVLIVACGGSLAPASLQARTRDGKVSGEAPFDRLCSEQGAASHQGSFADWLVERLNLNDSQSSAFREFQDARAKSISDSKSKLCANKPDPSSFEARLVFSQAFLEARLEAVKAENPKLIAFYNSLNDKQKKEFDKIQERSRRDRQ
jgi:hypothetical protein